MEFAQSPRSTLGIEWELQYIDADSHALRQCADSVMTALRALDTDTSSIHREMLLNTVEFVSEPHEHVRDCVEDMARSTSVLEPVIHPMRVRLGTAGTHPFSNPASQIVTDSERYAELVNRTQYWGRQMLLFGTHVHVGVDNRAKVWPLIRAALTRAYHIQALTSASPIWNSEVTGYASNRAMVFQRLPTAGIPYQFLTWEDFEKYVAGMVATGVIEQVNEVRWDIRPSPANGTIERGCVMRQRTVRSSAWSRRSPSASWSTSLGCSTPERNFPRCRIGSFVKTSGEPRVTVWMRF